MGHKLHIRGLEKYPTLERRFYAELARIHPGCSGKCELATLQEKFRKLVEAEEIKANRSVDKRRNSRYK